MEYHDTIVEEVHRAREEFARRFNFDLKAMCADLRKRQNEGGRRVVSFPPRPVDPQLTGPLPTVPALPNVTPS